MTDYVGFLVKDCLDPRHISQDHLFYCDFGPYGHLSPICGWPKEDDSPREKAEFIGKAISVYYRLRTGGYQNIAMAMTLDCEAFEGLEVKYLEKEASFKSYDDWLALKEIHKENQRREDEYVHKHKSGWGKIKGLLRGKQYRVSVRPKGVLAVAIIRGDLGEDPRSNDE